MKPVARFVLPCSLTVSFIVLLSATAFAGDDWRPVDPAELALKASVVEKDADAEALFWEVRVDDGEANELIFSHYMRVKVFTERGKESQSQIDIPYFGSSKIKDISARTIKPDGSIIELKKDDIHERTIVKVSGLKVKAKSFAMPGVEPGAIIEYRWREVEGDTDANYVDLQFQRDIPVRSVSYLVRPYTGPYAQGLAYRQFHMPEGVKFEKAKDGFYKVSLTNVPAYHEEPRMPPEDEVRSWILLFYNSSGLAPDKFWSDVGKRQYEAGKDEMKVNDDVRRKAAEIIGDEKEPDAKLRRIYESKADYVKRIEGWVATGAAAATVNKVEPRDDNLANRFNLDVVFVAPRYGQLMQNRLLVFKPAIVSRRESLSLTAGRRKQPVVLPANAYSETVRVRLPAGFDVDEMPDAVRLDTSFGSYATNYEVKDGQLIFTRKLVQKAATIPADQYNSVRSFFEKIRAAEQAPVVLARK